MPLSPKRTETKIAGVSAAWESLAKDASFGKLTLAQYKTKVKASFDARQTVKALEAQLTAAQNERDAADRDSLAVTQLIINGVKGDADFGEDSALYEALGYIPKSARKSGLRRGKKKTSPPA